MRGIGCVDSADFLEGAAVNDIDLASKVAETS
jgi:hypothetical protein